ncbi:MAG: hypothetical protein DCC58_19035 [Chloroflexi bacterium]|nr:MAG: hypothetical protein DCC58_19035 [Chloroflexota bacterium]
MREPVEYTANRAMLLTRGSFGSVRLGSAYDGAWAFSGVTRDLSFWSIHGCPDRDWDASSHHRTCGTVLNRLRCMADDEIDPTSGALSLRTTPTPDEPTLSSTHYWRCGTAATLRSDG